MKTMIKITVTPPNKPSFSREFEVLRDAEEFLLLLREQGYEAAEQSVVRTGLQAPDHKHDFKNSLYCSVCGVAEF
jgi:hypothetical protein